MTNASTETKPTQSPNDGGPAFPVENWVDRAPGMSLRDYFAAQALPSAIARMEFQTPAELADMASSIARACYFLADGMLAARERA